MHTQPQRLFHNIINYFLHDSNHINIEVKYCFHEGEGPCYVKALALRGTMYTLMSQLKEAIADLTVVIDMEKTNENKKVCVSNALHMSLKYYICF